MELDTEELDVVILQEECRELQRKVEALETENANLRIELAYYEEAGKDCE